MSQNLTFIISKGKVIPPKQYSMGLTAHQLSGHSKELSRILEKSGDAISYEKVLEADTALAEKSLKSLDPITGCVIPSNLQPGKVDLGSDNLDCEKSSSIAGHSAGVHVTQTVAFQINQVERPLEMSKLIFSKNKSVQLLNENAETIN